MPQNPKSEFEEQFTHRATRAQEKPEFFGGRPKCPRHLSPEAKAEWRRCVKLLEARKTITPGDYTLLTLYAETFARWIAAKAQLGNELLIDEPVGDSHGKIIIKKKINPLVPIVQNDTRALHSLARELGLTPATRQKVAPTKKQENEPPKEGSALWIVRNIGKETA